MKKTIARKEELKLSRHYKKIREKKQQLYVNVPLDWCVRFDLSVLDVVVFKIVELFSYESQDTPAGRQRRKTSFKKSVDFICACTNTTKPTVRKSLEKLEAKGFIYKKIDVIKGKNWVCYMTTIDETNANRGSIEEQLDVELLFRKNNATIRR